MKKIGLIVVAIIMSVSLLQGCKGKVNSKKEKNIEVITKNQEEERESGLYSVDGEMKYTWHQLIENGLIELNGDWLEKYNYYNAAELVIDKSIVGIDQKAFWQSVSRSVDIVSVDIPSTVESINENAFRECKKLTEVKLHDGLKKIGEGAFCGCSSLKKIELPDSVITMEPGIFSFCSALEQVKLPSNISELPGVTFAYTSLKSTDNIVNFENIKMLGDGDFFECENLEYINLSNIESIGECEFAKSAIKSIEINGNIKTIGERSFQECGNLEEVIFDEGVQEIGIRAFLNCEKIRTVKMAKSINKIDEDAFFGCKELTDINLPDGLEHIGRGAFEACLKLDLKVPESVCKIESNAFFRVRHVEYHGEAEDIDEMNWGAEKFN